MKNVPIATTIKKRDTFLATLTVKRDGVAVDLTSIPVTSQVRTQDGTLLTDLMVTKTDPVNGIIQISGPTDSWPEGEVVLWDVQFQEPEFTWSTPTRGIEVAEDVTQ